MKNYTIVSAFISQVNNRTDRSTEDYIKFGAELLALDCPKIIFIEKEYVDLVKSLSHSTTFIVTINHKELEFYNKAKNIELELPSSRNSEKDTKNYMALMTDKTYFCKRAIEINSFDCDNFIWMDFGISHILKNKISLASLIKKNYSFQSEKIHIGGIWDNYIANKIDNFNQINWFFAGGIFAGHKKNILRFHQLVTNQFIENLKNNKIVWEVNLWYQIYQKCPELFNIYRADHNSLLIKNL